MKCPFCGESNIDGVDVCQSCEQSLEFVSQPAPVSNVERCLLHNQVSTLPQRKTLIVAPNDSVSEVMQAMVAENTGCAVVCQGAAIVGIFSERDALSRLNVDFAELAHVPVATFMTPSPESIEADAEIAFALHKMDIGGYRHLPVLAEGRVVGLISIRDILRYIVEHLSNVEPADALALNQGAQNGRDDTM